MMQITRSFDLPFPVSDVWQALSDVRLVAACLPGASVTEELGEDRYKGRFTVKVGPLAASFDGDVEIRREPTAHVATVSGKGADARSASRASGSMTYRLTPTEAGTHVEVECSLALAGALAQFGKAGVVQDIASRITTAFVANLHAHMSATALPAKAEEAQPAPTVEPPSQAALDGGSLLWAMLRDRIFGFLRRLFGPRAA